MNYLYTQIYPEVKSVLKYWLMKFLLLSLFMLFLTLTCNLTPAFATLDPLAVPNNKFGIHIIQATPDESSPAASLVNSTGGDWGYITVLIESKDRNHEKWQEFFNDLRRRHLIPIIRIATKSVNGYWERPYEKEYEAWADFLDKLNWPVKNRYVTIYNEPNHGYEWGNSVDPKNYAEVLDKIITSYENKLLFNSKYGECSVCFEDNVKLIPLECLHFYCQSCYVKIYNKCPLRCFL